MITRLFASLALCACLFATPVSARDPLVLAPSSPWNLRYEDDMCRLVRVFGEGDERVELHISQSGIEPYFNLIVSGRQAKASGRRSGLSIQFGPDEEEVERSFIHGKLGDDKLPFIMMYGIQLGNPRDDTGEGEFSANGIGKERQAGIEWLGIGGQSKPRLRLMLPGFTDALAALRTCSEDLVRQLRLDPEGQAKIVDRAKMTNQSEIARTIVYPKVYVMKGVEGSVLVRMTINKEGKPTNCQIARSSRPEVFDDVVCLAMMQKGEFEPAIDDEGNRVSSYVNLNFMFRME